MHGIMKGKLIIPYFKFARESSYTKNFTLERNSES